MPILSLLIVQAGLFAVEPVADPLAGNTPDWQLCTHPDEAMKTCRVMSSFSRTADGQFSTISRSAVMGLPGLVIETTGLSYVKDGRLCGKAQLKELEGARVIRHVEGATPKQEASAIQSLRFLYSVEGKVLCSAFYPDGVNYRLETTVNGKSLPDLTTLVRWVHKDDGYTVAGWQGAITTPLNASR